MTLIHGTFCAWNDILDSSIDGLVSRTKTRPLPSGRVTLRKAILWFFTQLLVSSYLTFYLLGPSCFRAVLPAYALSAFYPLMKRWVQWPQFVLALTVAIPVVEGYVSIKRGKHFEWQSDDIAILSYLFGSYALWTVYFDTAYGLQDLVDDRLANIGSLAAFVGPERIKLFMSVLGTLPVILCAVAARKASLGFFFWTLGIGVWSISLPFQMRILENGDKLGWEQTGKRLFDLNIMMGLWITIVALGDLIVERVVIIHL